jgi:putative flippase GtrA
MFPHYLAVSALSLATDWLCFIALTLMAHIEAGMAAVAAYMVGGVINYSLSRRFVFRSKATGRRQIREILLFAASCILGALLTGAIVHVAAPAFGRLVAKLIAVIVSLVTLYWVRRLAVFNWERYVFLTREATR